MTAAGISVLIATYQRHEGLRRLLAQLDKQTLPKDQFEVIVVDDGSTVELSLSDVSVGYPLQLFRQQQNAGPAAARHRAALAASREVLVIIDDDMQVGPDFLEAHRRAHPQGVRRAAMGAIQPDPEVRRLPLFEQWNAQRLRRAAEAGAAGARLRGNNLWTGNVSFRRADYLAVGGFDLGLRMSEDMELGIRLENAGVDIVFNADAPAVHLSDHADVTWLRRAARYGEVDKGVSRKHPEAVNADPWRYYYLLPALVRPLLDLEIATPRTGAVVARLLLAVGQLLLRLGLRQTAIRVASIVYAAEYFRGVRTAEGTRAACAAARRSYLAHAAALPALPQGVPRRAAHWQRMRADLAADHATRADHEEKYGYAGTRGMGALGSFVQKIGVQIMTAIRLMAFFRDAGHPLLARISSRLIRHLYASDIHWDAQWAPGITIVHGFGLAISHAARIGPGCILFQNVCLGMGIDAATRISGAPALESAVHVGPGATLLGPVVIGARTKIMAGAVLTGSVPPDSLVETPAPRVRARQPPSADGPCAGAEPETP